MTRLVPPSTMGQLIEGSARRRQRLARHRAEGQDLQAMLGPVNHVGQHHRDRAFPPSWMAELFNRPPAPPGWLRAAPLSTLIIRPTTPERSHRHG